MDGGDRQGISAGELITALSAMAVAGEASDHRQTPKEELSKLGIRPEEVIQALSALTIQQVSGCGQVGVACLLCFIFQDDDDDDDSEEHRTCTQQQQRASSASPVPSLTEDTSGYLCLFPESSSSVPTAADLSAITDDGEAAAGSCDEEEEEEVGGVSSELDGGDSMMVDGDDEDLLLRHHLTFNPVMGHAHSADSQLAELDPFLYPPQSQDFGPPEPPSLVDTLLVPSSSGDAVEVGVDAVTEHQDPQSTSPLESVLYSQ